VVVLVLRVKVFVFFALNALDAATTLLAASRACGFEANPVVAWLLQYPAVFVVVKLAGGVAVSLAAYYAAKKFRVAERALDALIAVYALAVVNNALAVLLG